MSESEVSQIRDEDVLRRMWQQTEDFSRKKEIRAHMYRLREERLRSLYSPEPAPDGKGCEFSSAQGHVQSFADQTFQSMKSKEVRDAGSPPKEFAYRGQDLKELSNAGWNVESEDRTTDEGRTHVKSVNANIEGQYDVQGGRGQFAALDKQRRAVTEHHDDTSSLRRDEQSSTSAARDHVVRQTDDGTRVTSTSSSSNTSSKFQQVSSTKHETVPYVTDYDYDSARRNAPDTNRNEEVTRITNRNDYEQTTRKNDIADSELVSRKVEYPDDNTKVIVETRYMPDGTRVTSTRREFRVPVQSTRSEHQSRSQTQSYSSRHKSDFRDSTSKVSRHTIDNRTNDIVDSQRNVDDYDFKRQLREYTVKDNDDLQDSQLRYVTKSDKNVTEYAQTDNNFSQKCHDTRVDGKFDDQSHTRRHITDRQSDNQKDDTDRSHTSTLRDHDVQHKTVKESRYINDTEERIHNITKERTNSEEKHIRHISKDQKNIKEIIPDLHGDKTVPRERDVDALRDRTVPLEKKRDVPRDDTSDVPRNGTFKNHENSSDRAVPVGKVTDTPRYGSVPADKITDISKDGIPRDKLHDIPRDTLAPTEIVYNIHTEKILTDERVHNTKGDTKMEELVERKTSSDHYQTTYQNDFQSRKISTDWSPTHQAWASTLRADTPSTTHPSTRASSPGSRTFKSSNSSLRSSVSPDKMSKKPSSRGTSPNKIDRYSPTRTVSSDRYSSTHSTQSVTETRTNKYTSPERKPPKGRSPTRPGPDQKLQGVHRQRPSVSPEKKPQNFTDRPNSSPERKHYEKSTPIDKWPRNASPSGKDFKTTTEPRQSPERKPVHRAFDENNSNEYPQTPAYRSSTRPDKKRSDSPSRSPLRSSSSPDRKPRHQKDSYPPRPQHSSETVPKTSHTSPDRKQRQQQPRESPDKPVDEYRHPSSNNRPSLSPERKPSYIRPTVANEPEDKTNLSQKPRNEPEWTSPSRQVPALTPEGTIKNHNKTLKMQEDHYRFVDAETKVNTHRDEEYIDKKVIKTTNSGDSPSKENSPSTVNTGPNEDTFDFCAPLNETKSYYPQKDDVTKYYETDKINEKKDNKKHNRDTKDLSIKRTPIEDVPEGKDVPSHKRVTNEGTYDKKKLRDNIKTTEITTVTSEDVKLNSKTLRDKTSPISSSSVPSSPTKKYPRDSTSPVKSPSRDSKFKQTTDFLSTEKTTEEITKKVITKDRPRQLVTPSSSPTRQPKTLETEPSTGQSSPTTSVSGFVYFGSPPAETHLVTDLDDIYPENPEEISRRPETLDIKRSPSPSKIPCRSPSPEKHVPTTKEHLPRKSSLKKPSTSVNQASPIEKPPTSFKVSPTDDKPDSTGRRVIKKDNPREPETGEFDVTNSEVFNVKPKPPLQRRETYEDRCKKILGMVDDTISETVRKETRKSIEKTDSSQRPLSVSPSDSPKEQSPLPEQFSDRTTTTKVYVTDFISHEKEGLVKNNILRENKNTKTPPRQQSPTKLNDMVKKTDELPKTALKRPSISPDRKPSSTLLNQTQPSDQISLPRPDIDQTSADTHQKATSPSKKSQEKISTYSKTISVSKCDTISTDDLQKKTMKTANVNDKSEQEIFKKSSFEKTELIQDIPEQLKRPQSHSPSRSISKEGSPENYKQRDTNPAPDHVSLEGRKPESPEKTTNYKKSTTSTTSEYDVTYKTKEVSTTSARENIKLPTKNSSPNCQVTQHSPRADSPTKASLSSKRPDLLPQQQSPPYDSVEKPSNEIPADSVINEHVKLPGYMKSTMVKSTKLDTTIASENIVKKHKSSIPQKDSQPKLYPERRTPSPTKVSQTSNISPERKSKRPQQSASLPQENPLNKRDLPKTLSPTETGFDKIPGYMKATTSVTSKFEKTECDSKTKKDFHETITSTTTERESPRKSQSPIRHPTKPVEKTIPKLVSPTEPSITTFEASRRHNLSPERKPGHQAVPKDNANEIPTNKHQQGSPSSHPKNSEHPRTDSSLKPSEKMIKARTSPDKKQSPVLQVKMDSSPETKHPQRTGPYRSNISTETQRKSESFGRLSSDHEPKDNRSDISKPDEPRQLRTPSPTKKTSIVTETSTDFLITEREQEILNKVQNSLRKLSPDRKEKSPSRERSPTKSTTSLQDLEITEREKIQTDILENQISSEKLKEEVIRTPKVTNPVQPKADMPYEPKLSSKPSSRNTSPIKRTPSIPVSNKVDKTPESPTKSRSISPKKPVSYVERPQSPQAPRASGIKSREHNRPHLIRKPTPATLSPAKIERLTTDIKKSNASSKQNISTKTTTLKTTNRTIPTPASKSNEVEFQRSPTPKGPKENISPKKEVVTRTTSDIAMKPKKTSSPQRVKSKPEIQVIDLSTKSPKSSKPILKEPHSRMPCKPKSATALNTSTEEDDIIIDVQQSKSSRENSPDRICPTPVNFSDDIGTPRFPDEVSEPDDEFVKRTYHTIQETESVVDDIVEICEDEELFVKKSNMDVITEQDDSLLSVNDKVSKFSNKIKYVGKPKETTASTTFKDTEKRVHTDFLDESLKTDECLLTVSEKVTKFAKGPRDIKDSRSPSRKITDEYDKDTVYTDDYTKLSVNDKAHLFVETAENVKVSKAKPAQKVQRPDLSQVDECLKSDDCLLSVSDKVSKFVKTAEQSMTETHGVEDTESKIKDQHEKIIRKIVDENDFDEAFETKESIYTEEFDKTQDTRKDRDTDRTNPRPNEPKTSKVKDYPNSKTAERIPVVKITTLRSSEAVKKAKALFENIASTQKPSHKDSTHSTKTTKLTDIGVIKKTQQTDSTTVLYPSVEDVSPQVTDVESEIDTPLDTKDHSLSGSHTLTQSAVRDKKLRSSPNRPTVQSQGVPRSKSPLRHIVETTTTKTVLSRYPGVTRAQSPRQHPESPRHRPESPRRTESPRQRPESPRRTESPRQHAESPRQRLESPRRTESPRQRPESPRQAESSRHLPVTDKPEKIPGYLRPTKTSQIKEETKIVEDAEVSSRRGSGKFGVELRRTSVERSTVSSERRRSVDHHQPCIEDIFDLNLLEQMLEKVVGYEQRRRIRAQIRIAKNQSEHLVDTNTYTRMVKHTTTTSKTRSPERKVTSPEITPKSTPHKTSSPDRHTKSTPNKTISDRSQPKEPTLNGHVKEHSKTVTVARPQSPEKPSPKSTLAPRTPVRQPSPDKRRTVSPSKVTSKPKGNRFNEYASAYMKKVGLNETDKVIFSDTKTKKTSQAKQTVKHEKQQETVQQFTTTKSFTERTSSKDVIELVQTNGKRSPSPQLRQSPERKVQFPDRKVQVHERKPQSPEQKAHSPDRKEHIPEHRTYSPEQKARSSERLHQRTPSPDFKRPKPETGKETSIKTVYDIDKKMTPRTVQEEKPSWVTNRNLKKITSETRTYSSKKIENEKQKYRAPSPSKVISEPLDVITSSYGPGPLDADGKPLFGIKALRNGASNVQVKGTVIRSEFHSRNGGSPQGSVSVTAYSSQPEELERLLAAQGAPPSRIHGLAAITTTRSFGGDTGTSLASVHTKEDRASLEQFTHHDRKVEHLERTFDTTQEFSEDISTGVCNRTIEAKTDRQTDRNDRQTAKNDRQIDRNDRQTDKNDRQTDRNDRSTRREKVTEVKRSERKEKMEKREDKKTVRQSSVKSLTEKYIKSANDGGKGDRSTYPKAGLILRTTTAMRDSVSSDDAHPAGLVRTDSEHSLGSVDDTVVTTERLAGGGGVRTTTTRTSRHHAASVTHHEPVTTVKKTSTVITQEPVITHRVISREPAVHEVSRSVRQEAGSERSFLDSSTKVTGVQDILTRMKNADLVMSEGDSAEEAEARALLNKFLGASVLMAGMQGYVHEHAAHDQETVISSTGGKISSRSVEELDLDQCWDERLLRKLLDECTDYEQRRRLRARIRTLMAEQEACASAVSAALGSGGDSGEGGAASDAREEEEVTVTSSVRRDSSDKTVSSSTTTKTTKVIEMTRPAPKPVSPFAKFRQLEKQNSTNSPNSPKTPQSPGSPSQPYFKFTDPALQSSALTIKERLLQWCRDKTRDYENVKLENFSTSWADGLAFCALVHHFLPDAFDYSKLTPDRRRHNFTLAFKVADEKAGIYPLLDVEDMVAMRRPDWKCVFTYVQAIYRRFKDEQ